MDESKFYKAQEIQDNLGKISRVLYIEQTCTGVKLNLKTRTDNAVGAAVLVNETALKEMLYQEHKRLKEEFDAL